MLVFAPVFVLKFFVLSLLFRGEDFFSSSLIFGDGLPHLGAFFFGIEILVLVNLGTELGIGLVGGPELFLLILGKLQLTVYAELRPVAGDAGPAAGASGGALKEVLVPLELGRSRRDDAQCYEHVRVYPEEFW